MCQTRYIITVSPHFELDTQTLEVVEHSDGNPITHSFHDKSLPIKIFRDRMTGWFFDPAADLLNHDQTVAAVHLVTPLIEALHEHHKGESSKGKSEGFFRERAKIIFPSLSETGLHLLYKGVRCGFAHHGFLKDDDGHYNILITRGRSEPVEYKDQILWVDAFKYTSAIRDAFGEYCDLVEQGGEAQRRFLQVWNPDWQMSLRVPGAGGVISSA